MTCYEIENLVSCLIISYNEEVNIARVLDSIKWCSDVLVVDSGSNDKTMEIIQRYSNTRVMERQFDTFAQQCNYGLDHLSSEWVLSLDADYIVTEGLKDEIQSLFFNRRSQLRNLYNGYYIPFRYCVNGKPIRSGLLPPRVSFYRREFARYVDIGHAHRVKILGGLGKMYSYLLHDDRKSTLIWLSDQKRYQSIEADMLRNTKSSDLPLQDKLRKKTCLAPFLIFAFCIIARGGLFDGREGFIYAFQRLISESLLFVELHLDKGCIEE